MFDFKNLNNTSTEPDSANDHRRTKGNLADLCNGQIVHIDGTFQLRSNNYGPYAVFHVLEDSQHHYYAGKRITKMLTDVDSAGARAELSDQPVKFVANSATFDDGRTVTFYDVQFV